MRHARQTLTVVLVVLVVVSTITLGFTLNQVEQEKDRLEGDIQYRSSLLASSLKEPIESNFADKSSEYLQGVVEKFVDDKRIAGLAIIDSGEEVLAVSSSLPQDISISQKIAADAMDESKPNGDFVDSNAGKLYVFAEPLRNDQSVVGALVIMQNAEYIDGYIADIWQRNLIRLAMQALLFSLAVIFILRWIVLKPLRSLVAVMQLARVGKGSAALGQASSNSIFEPVLQEFSSINKRLARAKLAAQRGARSSLEKLDSPWTAERLGEFTKDLLKNRTIVAVSNREPYVHTKEGGKIRYYVPASGVVTALEPIMAACGGMWIAHGSGDADKLVTDKEGKIKVPPDDASYTLKRVWLTETEEQGYYVGFSNSGVWPLCHMVHTRPIFKRSDWEQYQKVNEKFAHAVLEEIKGEKNPIVIIQDYHFALLPRLIKDARPDAAVCIFWHIPWPTAEAFSICPWKKEMLDGLLGADIVGFHTQLFCNNFIQTAGKELEALIDLEQFSVTKNAHTSFVKTFPISIDFVGAIPAKDELEAQKHEAIKLREQLGVKSEYLAVGVERLDYTKGILERLKAVELFLEKYPSYKGKFTLVQIAAPSRTSVKEYRDFEHRVIEEVERVNNLFKRSGWKPIILINEHRDHEFIGTLYRAANLCLVTPLHDGMNLVAKEFVAARNDDRGVLILSQYAGAAQELRDALVVNPYDGQQVAEAIHAALTMKPAEQAKRMKKMRVAIKSHNVYQWSAEILKRMAELE